MQIRPVNKHDCALLSELAFRSKAFWGYSNTFMQSCREELAVSEAALHNPAAQSWLAENDESVLGYYTLEQLSTDRFELDALFVDAHVIGTGIGRRLMEHARSQAVAAGGQTIEIQSDPHAVAFYEAFGARLIGERESGSFAGRMLPVLEIMLH